MKRLYCIVSFCIVIVLLSSSAFSYEGSSTLIVESKFFSVYGHGDFDIGFLLTNLNFEYLLHPDTLLDEASQDNKSVLSKTLDALFLEVSDILDIHIYSFHGDIKILPDRDSINSVFKKFFKVDFGESSFYLPEKNTIYISYADLTLGMLGHEIAHAIISHYFVVPPPARVQEVLAGYVEYSLRKSTGTLP